MTVVGVDGCSDGWIAVAYEGESFAGGGFYEDIESVWVAYPDADSILVDVPVGLRESDNEPRACDTAARDVLGSPRGRSVFPPPIRETLDADGYAEAKAIQEAETDGSLGRQAWAIADKIREVDEFLRADPEARVGVVREAHPEVCFWGLAGERPMTYSKTSEPAAAFWERVDVLATVDGEVLHAVHAVGRELDCAASNDDLLDAFALELTASPRTPETRTLPEAPETDPRGLPMEMVYTLVGE